MKGQFWDRKAFPLVDPKMDTPQESGIFDKVLHTDILVIILSYQPFIDIFLEFLNTQLCAENLLFLIALKELKNVSHLI